MRSVVDCAGVVPDAAVRKSRGDRFVRLGEVLVAHRGHYCAPETPLRPEPESAAACRIVRQRNIRPFSLAGKEEWVEYPVIVDALRQARQAGGRSHRVAFPEEVVFAPVKLVLAERDRPIRAALRYEPVYPARGKILTLQPDQGSWMAYAALAVLNSAIGQSCYQYHLREMAGRDRSPSGLSHLALSRVPIAARDYSPRQLEQVVSLAYQISTLHEAARECRISFRLMARDLQQRLLGEVCALLRLSEPEARRWIDSMRGLALADRPDATAQLSIPGIGSPELPQLPPLRLLAEAQRQRLADYLAAGGGAAVTPSSSEIERLRQLAYWEQLINAVPPAELRLEHPVSSEDELLTPAGELELAAAPARSEP
jgi:hypothetical protein